MVTSIYDREATTTTTATVILSDNATPASGVYAIYLRPELTVPERMDYVLDSSFEGQGDISGSFSTGTQKYSIIFEGWWDASKSKGTNWQNLLKALKKWSDDNTFVYLWVEDSDGNNLAQIPDGDLNLQQVQGKVLGWICSKWDGLKRWVKIPFRRETLEI